MAPLAPHPDALRRPRIPPSSLSLALAILVLLPACGKGLSEQELRGRADSSRPTWQNYLEDLKAQIGAGPVAQWQGEPVRAQCKDGEVRIEFRLTSPWAQREAAVPILIRDPGGNVRRNARVDHRDGRLDYVFECPRASRTSLMWVEVKFPHDERRLTFSSEGIWEPAAR